MSGVLKGGANSEYVVSGSVNIKNNIEKTAPVVEQPQKTENETYEQRVKREAEDAAQKRLDAEKKRLNELERERNDYKKHAEIVMSKAVADAQQMKASTQEACDKMIAEANEEATRIMEVAEANGFKQGNEDGYEAGMNKGYEEGYRKGLLKCKDTLLELKTLIEEINDGKSELFHSYESELFQSVFDIAQKITMNSLKQKDKAVIQGMIKDAGRKFRNSTYVKVTLSKLDIDEEMSADYTWLRSLFGEHQNVEIELSKEAPQGTLIIDNGSEITDASVSTQLKMIEELGRGKFKEQPDSRKKAEAKAKPDEE